MSRMDSAGPLPEESTVNISGIQKAADCRLPYHPRRPVVRAISRRRPAILAQVVTDVLGAAEHQEQPATCATVMGRDRAGEGLELSAARFHESLRASVRHTTRAGQREAVELRLTIPATQPA